VGTFEAKIPSTGYVLLMDGGDSHQFLPGSEPALANVREHLNYTRRFGGRAFACHGEGWVHLFYGPLTWFNDQIFHTKYSPGHKTNLGIQNRPKIGHLHANCGLALGGR